MELRDESPLTAIYHFEIVALERSTSGKHVIMYCVLSLEKDVEPVFRSHHVQQYTPAEKCFILSVGLYTECTLLENILRSRITKQATPLAIE